MTSLRCVLVLFLAVSGVWPVQADDVAQLYRRVTYQEVRTWHEQFLLGNPTKAERLDAMRSVIRTSKLGDRGLDRVFHDFEGRYAIDPRVPGVEKSVLLQMSGSTSQTTGYRRELLYASAFQNDKRFSLEAMNRRLSNTDADIVIRHRPSGLYGRIEVKDYSLNSQATNLTKLKNQIDKMATLGRKTGAPQFWINRRAAHPALRAYAEKRGVLVLENVSTGRSSAGKTMSMKEAQDIVEHRFSQVMRTRAIVGGSMFAYGAWMLVGAAPAAWDDTKTTWDPSTRTGPAWRRLGEHGSYVLAGGSMVVSGSALLASGYASEALQRTLYSVGQLGGVASAVFLATAEGFKIARYLKGDITPREFWTGQWILSSAAVGSLAGSYIGGTTGALIFGEPTLLAALGGSGGAWLGQKIARQLVDEYYDWKYEKFDRAFADAVYARYGIE